MVILTLEQHFSSTSEKFNTVTVLLEKRQRQQGSSVVDLNYVFQGEREITSGGNYGSCLIRRFRRLS